MTMSEARATMRPVNETLEQLVELASDTTTLGRIELLDRIATYTAQIRQRPHDIENVGGAIDELTTELAYTRTKTHV